jgi:hypothetical protein
MKVGVGDHKRTFPPLQVQRRALSRDTIKNESGDDTMTKCAKAIDHCLAHNQWTIDSIFGQLRGDQIAVEQQRMT